MPSHRIAAVLLAVLSTLSITSVRAQGARETAAAPGGMRDPGDPKVRVPPARYASAFERYRANAEVEVAPWRESNDTVGRIGGWRAYGKEAAGAKVDEQQSTERKGEAGARSVQPPAHGHKH